MNNGFFSGNPKTEWLPDGRNMKLLERFSYTDSKGKEWIAPEGSVTDGASIPKALWTLIGGPFEGQYRNAAIIHDVVCQNHKTLEERRSGDRMFYRACLAGGCSKRQSIHMYLGVRTGTNLDFIGDGLHALHPVDIAPDPLGFR
jgi:hypothetical protein